ncbi:DNA alkylation repair protein [Candidatus Saccharibacteria bacterium]|nr:DNA alkylation repair protein [Candidatus Saccharibacteria bacterium]
MKELRLALMKEADDEYREFCMKGIPCDRPFIGVRIPKIQEIANQMPTSSYEEILTAEPVAIEEVMARGMVIAKLPYPEMLKYFDSQVVFIDNWCTCDIFCSRITKLVKKHREEFLELKIEPLLKSSDEFNTRVGLVLLKTAYMDFDYLALIFDRVENLKDRDEYYVKMAIAWLLSECFIKFPEATFSYLQVSKLPKWIFNKTISKICDSYRVEPEMKEALRKLRK